MTIAKTFWSGLMNPNSSVKTNIGKFSYATKKHTSAAC